MRTLKLKVDKPVTEPRIDKFLARSSSLSPDRIRALLSQGAVKIRGKAAKPNRKLWGGEELEVELPEPRALPKQHGPTLPVLFEDDRFIVIDKPKGLTVEPEQNQLSVVELLATQAKGFDVEGVAAPGVAHRLDKDTTGCLILAKTDDALAALKAEFESKGVDKRYLAVVEGAPKPSDSLDTPYGRNPDDPRLYTTRVESPRRARLSYTTLEQLEGAALLEVVLDTGRTHQIRAQLSDVGHPIVGDSLYGRRSDHIARFALHAKSLRIPKLEIDVAAPKPADLEQLLQKLRRPNSAPV